MRWFKFYPEDYLRGVLDLTAEEAGVYMALLALMYERGGAIPNDDRWICGHARLGARAWHRVRDRLCRLGKIIVDTDGTLANRRVLFEIETAKLREENHRNISVSGGKASAKSRAESNKNNELVEPAVKPKVNQYKKKNKNIPLPSEEGGKAAPKPLIAFPENWVPSEGMRTFATRIGFSPTEFEAAAGEFRDYWLERPLERRTAGGWSIAFQKSLKSIATSESLRAQLRLVVTDGQSLAQPTEEDRREQVKRILGTSHA